MRQKAGELGWLMDLARTRWEERAQYVVAVMREEDGEEPREEAKEEELGVN